MAHLYFDITDKQEIVPIYLHVSHGCGAGGTGLVE